MKRILQILLNTPLLFACFNLWASDVPNDAIDLAEGKLYIQSSGYSVGSSSGTLISHTGTYNIFSSEVIAEYLMYLQSGAGEQDIAIWNLTNNYSSGLLFDKSESDISLTVHGDNYALGSTRSLAFLSNTDHTLSVLGDSLTLNGLITGIYGASNISLDLSLSYLNIDLASGTQSIGQSSSGYQFRKVEIADNGVLTSSGSIYADTIIIGKASVNVLSLSVPAINTLGDTVYCVTVARGGSNSITVSDVTNNTSETYNFTSSHPDDDNYYIYLPNGSYTFNNGGGSTYEATVDGASVTASLPVIAGDGVIDVSDGVVVINEAMYYIGAQPYSYSEGSFILSGSSTEWGVTVESGADSITLHNVDIQLSNGCAFNLSTGSDAVIIIEGSNTLVSGSNYAGLQKSSTAGILTISGTDIDTLIAIGGNWSAGIGSGLDSVDCTNIIIAGGVINATGPDNGAGIGGAYKGDADNITIIGGQIIAVSDIGAGIGAGWNATGNNITINGGVITATSNGSGIGSTFENKGTGNCITGGVVYATGGANGKALDEGIQISGGSVYTKMLKTISHNSKYGRAFIGGQITGGSVNLLGTGTTTNLYTYDDGTTETVGRPVNADSTLLYRSQYVLPDITEMTLVDSISINGTPWNCNDLYTDTTGSVYLWLPVSDADTVYVSTEGKTYAYLGNIVEYDDYVPGDDAEGILEYGNYLWQVPLSVKESELGSINVATFDDTLTSTGFVCYNTDISVWAGEEIGYQLDSLVMNGTVAFDDSIFTLTDTMDLAAYYSLLEYIISFYNVDTDSSLLDIDTVTYGSAAAYNGETPLLDATAQYTFSFKSWDQSLENIVKDLSVYTVYDSILNQYEITLVENAAGTLTAESDGIQIASGDLIDYGAELVVSASAGTGYFLDSITVNGEVDTASEMVVIVTEAISVEAYYHAKTTGSGETGVEALSAENIWVYGNSGALCIHSSELAEISVYSVSGAMVTKKQSTDTVTTIAVPQSGLYIIRVRAVTGDTRTFKCIVQ